MEIVHVLEAIIMMLPHKMIANHVQIITVFVLLVLLASA